MILRNEAALKGDVWSASIFVVYISFIYNLNILGNNI